MMSPSANTNRSEELLGRIVEMTALECGIWIKSVGSTTRRAKHCSQGLEPDESYYLRTTRPAMRAVPIAEQSPPDLAIEVDLRRSELERLQILRDSLAFANCGDIARARSNSPSI